MMRRLLDWLRVLFGLHSVRDGSTCRLSREIRNVHDYPEHKGGDGTPSHFYTYKCSRCGQEFTV
jgi:hypothetical protein